MKYRPTTLNIAVAIYLIGILVYSILFYKGLSAGEGWGIVAMVGLFGLGLLTGLVDFLLQLFIKNRIILNIIGVLIIILLAVFIASDL